MDVVACTRFCEQPALAHVGGTKDPDVAAIVRLAPELVVVDREENRREDADALTAAGAAVHVTDVTSLHEVAPTLAELAVAVGAPRPDAPPLRAGVPPVRRAFVPIWKRPWMTVNGRTYGGSLLAHLGIDNVFADDEATYPVVEVDDVRRRSPELVLLPSEPYPFAERHLDAVATTFPGARPLLIDGKDLFWWGVRTPAAVERLAAVLDQLG